LVGEGHAGKTYELAGESWDYRALARAAEAALGRPVEFQPRTVAEQKAALMGLGMDEGLAGFFAAVDASIESGSLDHTSGDLAKLLGRPPLGLGAAVAKLLA
jgi:NAD(P)H dehydrogenase (quinone)